MLSVRGTEFSVLPFFSCSLRILFNLLTDASAAAAVHTVSSLLVIRP